MFQLFTSAIISGNVVVQNGFAVFNVNYDWWWFIISGDVAQYGDAVFTVANEWWRFNISGDVANMGTMSSLSLIIVDDSPYQVMSLSNMGSLSRLLLILGDGSLFQAMFNTVTLSSLKLINDDGHYFMGCCCSIWWRVLPCCWWLMMVHWFRRCCPIRWRCLYCCLRLMMVHCFRRCCPIWDGYHHCCWRDYFFARNFALPAPRARRSTCSSCTSVRRSSVRTFCRTWWSSRWKWSMSETTCWPTTGYWPCTPSCRG